MLVALLLLCGAVALRGDPVQAAPSPTGEFDYGWALTWTFPGNQRVTNMWNAVSTQTGQSERAADAGWNATIPAGGTDAFGFEASFSGANPDPGAFSLNGTACTTV